MAGKSLTSAEKSVTSKVRKGPLEMKQIELGKTGISIPVLGQGTYRMGQYADEFRSEVEALQYGIELGMTLIDTAETYADGGAEEVVGAAIKDVRDKVFVVTKVWPHHAAHDEVLKAADRSVKRLGGPIDLYLLHWPSREHPVSGTMRAMEELVAQGLVRYIGVSNFTPDLMQESIDALQSNLLACNQVEYHLNSRNIENDVIPYSEEHGITVMAYSPFGQGEFPTRASARGRLLADIGNRYGKSPYQVALNWLLNKPYICAIPKAVKREFIKANAEAVNFVLTDEDRAAIDKAFPRPTEGMYLTRF